MMMMINRSFSNITGHIGWGLISAGTGLLIVTEHITREWILTFCLSDGPLNKYTPVPRHFNVLHVQPHNIPLLTV
jgi:hypothetical protein